jgi:hypothetical protein
MLTDGKEQPWSVVELVRLSIQGTNYHSFKSHLKFKLSSTHSKDSSISLRSFEYTVPPSMMINQAASLH